MTGLHSCIRLVAGGGSFVFFDGTFSCSFSLPAFGLVGFGASTVLSAAGVVSVGVCLLWLLMVLLKDRIHASE